MDSGKVERETDSVEETDSLTAESETDRTAEGDCVGEIDRWTVERETV